MLSQIRDYLERKRKQRICKVFQPGKTISRFIAKDVKREVLVVSADEIDDGFITARVRTNNILYLNKRLTTEQDFGSAQRIAIAELWNWSGKSWGGLADGTSIVDHVGTGDSNAKTGE